MKSFSLALLTVLAACQTSALAQTTELNDRSAIVQRFLVAFNNHDPEGMALLVTEDIKWISVLNGSTSVEVEGKANLIVAMEAYFDGCPSCRSTIAEYMVSQERVSAIEVASWVAKSGPRSQQSLAVYEFAGGQISAVYYYPAEPVETPTKLSE